MDSNVNNLILLQTLDEKLDFLEKAKGDLPMRVAEVRERLDEQEIRLESQKKRMSELQLNRISIEGRLEVFRVKHKDFQEKLYAVSTNREYDAVTAEIDTAAKVIDEQETEVLTLIEEEEALLEELREMEKGLISNKNKQQEQEAELSEILARNAELENQLRTDRETLVTEIPIVDIRTYERIRKGRDGLVMVRIIRGACNGCYTQIPPQRVMEVRIAERLYACESCGRLLFWQEEPETEAEIAEAVEA